MTDHFKSLVLVPGVTQAPQLSQLVVEADKTDLPEGEKYIGLTLVNGGLVISQEELAPALEKGGLEALVKGKETVDLHFTPYFLRANRGGKHQMRVGIRTLD